MRYLDETGVLQKRLRKSGFHLRSRIDFRAQTNRDISRLWLLVWVKVAFENDGSQWLPIRP